MTHLDPTTIDAILDGSLDPAQASRLREHLEQPCEVCERALDDSGFELDDLLRFVEASDILDPSLAEPLSAVERDALWQDVRAELPDATPAARVRRPRWRAPAGIVVAFAMAAALLLFFRQPDPYDGIKGDGEAVPAPPELELRVVVGQQEGSRVDLGRRVGAGEQVASSELLLFEIEVDRPAARYLFVVDGAGEVVHMAPAPGAVPELQAAGSAPVGVGGSWVVLDLVDVPSPITIVAAASTLPVDAVSEVAGPWRSGEHRSWVAYDSLVVEIAP